jgi:hypothetical protein
MNPRLIHHLEEGLVHQSTSVERVTRSFVLQLPVSEAVELLVNQGKEVVHCLRVALTDLEEELSDRCAVGCLFVRGHFNTGSRARSLTSRALVKC